MNEEPMDVAAVIIAFNEAQRIRRALRSVLRQELPVREIIVVDDGSTDGTPETVAEYCKSVTCIRQTNQGQSAARNRAIERSSCRWIAFLDADDEWFSHHIRNAWALLRPRPEIVWYCAAFEIRIEDGEGVQPYLHSNPMTDNGVIKNYFVAEAKRPFSKPSAMLVRKSVLQETGLFDEKIGRRGEDLDMWFRIALRYPKLGYSAAPGCVYWRRNGSMTSQLYDVESFLTRIKKTCSAGSALRSGLSKESRHLVRRWVVDAIKDSIKDNDNRNLALIRRQFGYVLPMKWLLATLVFQPKPVMSLAQMAWKSDAVRMLMRARAGSAF